MTQIEKIQDKIEKEMMDNRDLIKLWNIPSDIFSNEFRLQMIILYHGRIEELIILQRWIKNNIKDE